MLRLINKILTAVFPPKVITFIKYIKKSFFDGYAVKSYSQEGEDMILRCIFEKQATGFYVDVGAYHPKRFSNTYFFYKLGWKGINIDAMPGSMKRFDRDRPRDINLEAAVSNKKDKLTYYIFSEPALNSFSKEISEREDRHKNNRIISKIMLKTQTLEEILDNYLPPKQTIDFLSIDVEGFDLNVLQSNNWAKYRPKVILVEALPHKFYETTKDSIYNYLKAQGYSFYAKTVNTHIFKLNSPAEL